MSSFNDPPTMEVVMSDGQTPNILLNKKESDASSWHRIPVFHLILAAFWTPFLLFAFYVEVSRITDALPTAPLDQNMAAHIERSGQAMKEQDRK